MTTNRNQINETDLIRPPKFIHGDMYEVEEGWCAVVTEGGAFKELLDPGTYKHDFSDNVKISEINTGVNTLPVLTVKEFTIPDVSMKIDLDVSVEYQAKDPGLVATETSEPLKILFDLVIQALRSSIVNTTIIELTSQGNSISQSTMQKLQAINLPELLGIEISEVQVTRLFPANTASNRLLLVNDPNSRLQGKRIKPEWLRTNHLEIYKKLMEGEIQSVDDFLDIGILDDPAAFLDSSTKEKRIQFSVYHPTRMVAESWSTLLAYVHLENAIKFVQDDAQIYIDKPKELYNVDQDQSTIQISAGSEITIVPYLEGCQFNPPQSNILFFENWHRIIFRVRPQNQINGITNNIAKGKITFFAGAVIIAEIEIWAKIVSETETAIEKTEILETTNPYQSVFVSYAHSDVEIIEYLEVAYEALGIQYLRDVHFLRSGEKWNEKILTKIEEADIFQLCWSENARDSQYVKQEWKHALKQQRDYFLRPIFWKKPISKVPEELADIHFAYLDIGKLNKLA